MNRSSTLVVEPPQQHYTNGHLPHGWLDDMLEALNRDPGPFTVDTAAELLEEEAVELYNGWVVPQAMTDIAERRVVATIQSMLDISARQSGFGQALPDQHECLLHDKTVIKPDASLVSWQRLDKGVVLRGKNQHGLLDGCPELVIEARSPSNSRVKDAAKRALYFQNGTQIVWDVDEAHKAIYVYYADRQDSPLMFGLNDEIDCKPLIANWRRRVADIFDEHASARAVAGEVAEQWTEEGIELGREQIALSMLQDGLDIALIARYTGLEPNIISGLRKS